MNNTANVPQNLPQKATIMQVLANTRTSEIAELDFVRKKFIANYNSCHRQKIGELMYHRQVVFFKQALATSEKLRSADPFSLYACFLTVSVKGWSLDPQDNEAYLVPLDGKAFLWPQAGAHVRRLMQTNQIEYAEQSKFVYKGDEFEVENGRVKKHTEKFQSEEIIAAYIRMVIDENGADRFFIYRKSDWESWKKKSQQRGGDNWTGGFNGQPSPGFLRTKVVKHACLEKCWAAGDFVGDQYGSVVIAADDLSEAAEVVKSNPIADASKRITAATNTTPAANENAEDFTETTDEANGVMHEDETF